MAAKKPEFTSDGDKAWDIYDVAVQCGSCYMWYDGHKSKCPCCGSKEMVGNR